MASRRLPPHFNSLSATVATLLLVLSFQNCNQATFESGVETKSAVGNPGGDRHLGNNDNDATGVITQTGGPNCRKQLNTVLIPIKPIFVVDISGSNVGQDGAPPTDPNRVVRGNSIERFYNTYKAKTNFSWSFSVFSGTIASTLLSMGNAAQMANAITAFRATGDAGNTPYIAALDAARAAIVSDVGRAPDTKYMVVFLSDGKPNPAVADGVLNNKVQDLVSTVPGSVSLNTLYYGGTNPDASTRLKMMAQNGGGNFLDTNVNPTGTDFLISDLVVIPGIVCD